MDIKSLKQEGYSIRAIAELTGHSRNTVRRALRAQKPKTYATPKRTSALAAYQGYVTQRYQECGLSAVRLHDEIKAQGYTGGVDTIRRFVRRLPVYQARQRHAKMTVRFETPPGLQAQCDWASCGTFRTPTGETVKVYAFVMVLSFSRQLYVEFTTAMDLPVLLQCHLHAFAFFGGFPQQILYDNMKQVRLSQQQFNPLLLDFAQHYGITPKTHQIRRPRTKGKVERMVHYLKDNFLNGRSFSDLDDLQQQGRAWLSEANARVHATTGQVPQELLKQEKLTRLNAVVTYQVVTKCDRKVDASGFIHFARSRYSVPPEHVGETVIVEQGDEQVLIRSAALIIAEHKLAPRAGACMALPEHIEQMWKLTVGKPAPPTPGWHLTWQEAVAQTPLAVYEEVAR
jgi:transposase